MNLYLQIHQIEEHEMATYNELSTLYSKSVLKPEITSAVGVAANNVVFEDPSTPNHNDRYTWAAKAAQNPDNEADRFLMPVLILNKDSTVEEIENLDDTTIQGNVDLFIDVFALYDAGLTTTT